MRLVALLLLLSSVLCHPSSSYATEVQEVTSPGGLKAWLVEEHALPLVAVKILFKNSGSAYDPPGKEGLAGMTSALLLEGAGDLDSHAFNEQIENHAIQLNFGIDEDLFRGSVESLSEHKDKAFATMAMALTHPRFDASAIERVRAQTQSILTREEQEPHYILHRAWEKLAFGTHPYGRSSLGTKESIAAISKDDFIRFTQHYLSKENILISVVGDITPAELGRLLDAHFSSLSEHYAPDVKLEPVRLPEKAQQIVSDFDVPQTTVFFGENGLMRSDPSYYSTYVMNQILGGGGALTSRLGIEIRTKRGLAYTVNSGLEPMDYSALWVGSFATRNEKVGAAMQVLRDTLQDFSRNGPTDQEMADAKKHLTGSFVLGLDSNGEIANFLLSMQLHHLGRDYLDKRNAIIMAVKKEDVKAVAKKLLDPSHLLVVMVGKPNLEVK